MDSSSKYSSTNRAYPYPKDLKVEESVPDKLQPSNYFEWKKQMLDIITRNGLLGFIDGTVKRPPETQTVIINNGPNGGGTNSEERKNEEYVAWKESDDLVQNKWIKSRLTYSIRRQVEHLKTAKEVWEALPRLVEDIKKRLNHYLPLYKAAIEGEWEKAAKFFTGEESDAVLRAPITLHSETALIVAVRAVRRNRFMEELVNRMSPTDLAISDDMGRTALHRAAGSGNIDAAKLLVGKNRGLLHLETHFKQTPLYYAAARGDRKMILWLMEVMELKTKPLEGKPGFDILYQLIISDLYDIALTVLRDNPKLAFFIPEKEEGLKFHALTALAGNPSSFPSGNNFSFLQEFIYSSMKLENNIPDRSRRDIEAPPASNNSGAANGGWGCAVKKRLHAMFWKVTEKFVPLIKPIREKKMLHDQALALLQLLCEEVIKSDFSNADRIFQLPLQQATSVGIPEIVEKILGLYPYAISFENHQKQSIFQQAIVFRQEKVFNLIHQLEESKEIVLSKWDTSGNNSLHLAGYVADPQLVYLKADAAFQMQRELQWFKEVEGLVASKNKEQRNKQGKTPAQVFSDTHKELVKEGEQWMKATAESCTIIASLIATVVFAAAIQVPGGSDDNGRPIFNQQTAFTIFSIANMLALFSSIASVLMFLSIFTSSYAEEEFLFALPNRLITGLISLFASILFTIAAFGATFYLTFGENKGWILIPVVVLGCLPVIMLAVWQSPLLVKMIKSTYGSSIFVKRSDRMLL
ncbi:uncharacterized protein LOC131334552 [Rhododendron vialii]|uniref:uncharacterized protein LOC131334552 n=1 Tax=Rhododendron vialii TaxID=182163 RepID=UPI002660492F|nr:uncharacterized protein LOC131334552 [Rhododendron vialii]